MNTRDYVLGRWKVFFLGFAMLSVGAWNSDATDRYVATNGTTPDGTKWSTAYTNIQDALDVAAKGDTIYLAGHTFLTTNQIIWAGNTNVTIRGGYAASSDVGLPGNNDPNQWPTIITRNPAYSNRLMMVTNVTTGTLDRVTLTGGYRNQDVVGGGMYVIGSTGLVLSACVISNNTVIGNNVSIYGGGIYAKSSVILVSNCQIRANLAATSVNWPGAWGGGIYILNGQMLLVDTIVVSNRVTGSNGLGRNGGGISTEGAICQLRNCLVVGNNTYSGLGDGLYAVSGTLTFDNCTIAHNAGQGINRVAGTVAGTNSIIWGNGNEVVGDVTLTYCNNLSGDSWCDPLFIDTTYFHLQSKQGMYTGGYFSGGSWSTSLSNSPVIDAGAPTASFSREPIPNGSRVNMGYDGNTPVASLTDTTTVFTLAVVTNLGPTRIGHRTVRLNGQVIDTGGQLPECQLVYWVTGAGTTSSVAMGLMNSSFHIDLTGLTPGSNYQCAVFASNSAGGVWSNIKPFSTAPSIYTFYVATNGNDTTGSSWSTAYTNPQTAFSVIEPGDSIFLAGQTFRLTNQLTWTASGSFVRVSGGYAATNDSDQPGAYDVTLWPTFLTRNAAYSNRLMFASGVVSSTLERVTLTGGYRVQDGYAGAIYILSSTGLSLSTCVISNNTVIGNNISVYGGGVYVNASIITMSNCQLRANTSATSVNYPGAWGGGIYALNGQVTILNSIFTSNKVTGSNGLGRNGGGICTEGATCWLRNCLVAGNNTYSGLGDGLYALSGVLSLENNTVVNNAGQGLIRVGGTVALTNSIFWGNGDDLTGTASVAYCDIQNANDTFWTNGINGCVSGSPLFVNTNVADYHLMRGSPCINTGVNLPWMSRMVDLDGSRRILAGLVDMGAYEFPAPDPAILIELR